MNNKLKTHVLAFTTVLLWGSGFPFTKVIGEAISPVPLAALRCLISAVILVIIGKFMGIRKPFQKTDLIWFFVSGMFGFSVYFIFFNMGLSTLTSATSSIITASAPILTAIGVYFIYREKINLTGWISIMSAFIGVLILILWNGILSINIGILWMFLCAAVFAGYNILNKMFTDKGYTSMEIVTYSVLFGAIQMIPWIPQAFTQIATANFSVNTAMIYLCVMPSALAYFFWSKAISLSERTSEVTNYLFVNPLIAAIIGFIMLHEIPDMGTFIGGFVIIASVIVFSTKGNPDKLPVKG